jgi:hypothetical protein
VCLSHTFGKSRDLTDGNVLIHQLVEPVLPRPAALPHLALYRTEPIRQLAEPRSLNPVLSIELLAKHPAVLQLDHATSTANPS